jgi:2-phospho-L-lactate transferase/gluconeogenesis factor (CofD/UPF0052 family)
MLQDVQRADAVVYGMGSLYTSICPTLILDGVGEAVAARTDIPKVGTGRLQGKGKVYLNIHMHAVCAKCYQTVQLPSNRTICCQYVCT